jgi:uncharacterized surface protein with fasciclin (FAS1) repeats
VSLSLKAAQGWPRVTSEIDKLHLISRDAAKTMGSLAQMSAQTAFRRLTTQLQQLGAGLSRIRESAKPLMARNMANSAKWASWLAASKSIGGTFSACFEKWTSWLSSFDLSSIRRNSVPNGSSLAAAGIAATLFALAFLAGGHTQIAPSAQASLTFPLPERPVVADPTTVDAALEESADAIERILTYVAARSTEQEDEAFADVNPILAKMEAMEGFDEFVRAAKTVDLEQLLKPGEAYTIFLPNDAAFAKLDQNEIEGLLDPTGHERLLMLLSHHIVPVRMTLDDLKRGNGQHLSLADRELTVRGGNAVQIGDASIVDADLEGDNSILHIIDRVLTIPEL